MSYVRGVKNKIFSNLLKQDFQATATVEKALEAEKGLILHSDQGCQCTSWMWREGMAIYPIRNISHCCHFLFFVIEYRA